MTLFQTLRIQFGATWLPKKPDSETISPRTKYTFYPALFCGSNTQQL